MENIVTSSRRVTEIMGEVVEVSLAQSAKLGEVTQDITQMTTDTASALPPSAPAGHAGAAPAARPAAGHAGATASDYVRY